MRLIEWFHIVVSIKLLKKRKRGIKIFLNVYKTEKKRHFWKELRQFKMQESALKESI